ncbi:von Willebrand factor A domain-containing protein 7-like [Pecten maximus]|uniref:von Willebrand factor A domain-containing protein 7-like n=1 Tax=Pecten maximus TaxID=6579 RepID=UPI0014586F3B|nr:von Willebrand factor A domain-containing protein 7-like [Pecten maximus]
MKARQFADAVSSVYQSYHMDPDYTVNSERIKEAHIIVQDTRMEIMSLLSAGTLTDAKVELLIKKVGKCLMIIQSFYSNTNWVEMNGGTPYLDFGSLATLQLMQIASTDEATCNSCDDRSSALRLGSCDSNLLVTDRLTSGYWYGQNHSPKPSADPASVKGKCSHGGLRDSGKDTPATGGINKETTDRNLSPHSHLHPQASEAAIQATVEFFIHSTSGILTDIDQDKILNLFGLQRKSRTSLGFAIDVSGSMSNDIAHVKAVLSKRVNEERVGTIEPSKYVLATFNDPESLTTVASTVDGDEMIRWLDALSVSGGGDCPEYAISGLLAAIELSELNSVIIVATDADAKDTYNAATAVGAANAKGIKVEFLLTGSCSRRRRYVPLRHKRDLATFQSIAGGTGGTVYRIGSSELPTILDKLLEESFTPSTSVMDYFVQTTSEGHSMDVYVDSEIDSLVITISGPYSLTEASLADPTGTVDIFSTGNATRSYSSSSITMTIQNPTPGTWVLTRSAIRQWEVNINVYSDLDIDFQLIETDDSGIYYVSNRNPIIGENYTLAVEVYNLNSAASSFAMNILDEDGTVTVTAPINITFLPSITTGYTSIEIPSTNFYVQLSGIDQNGYQFKRMVGTLVTPVAVDLFVQPIYGNLAIGTPQDVTYTLRNLGDTTETYTVTIVDDKGRVLSPSSRLHSVNAGKNITGTFQLSSIVELEYITYTVSVNVHGSSIVLQSTTYTAMFTGPFCSSVMASPKCNQAIAESSNCSTFTWSATAVFSFDVWIFQVADDVTVTIDGVDSTRLHINGNCCVRNFTVNASPSTGSGCQVSQLVTTSTSYELVVNDNSKDDDEDIYLTEDTGTNIGLIVGVLLGVGVLVLAVTGLLKYVSRKTDAVKEDGVIEFKDETHADTSQRTRFDPKLLDPKSLQYHNDVNVISA